MIIGTGNVRYLTRLNPLNKFIDFLKKAKENKTKQIFEGSFLQKMLFPTNPKNLVTSNP